MCRPSCPFHPPVVRKYLPGQTQPDGFPLTPSVLPRWSGEWEKKERRRRRKKKEKRKKEGIKKEENEKKVELIFFFFSLSAGKLTARCSGNFKLLPRLPVRVGWTLELEDIHGESFGEWSLNFFLSPSPLFAQRILKYNSTFVIFPSFRLFIYLFFEDRVFFELFPIRIFFYPES